MELDRNTTFRWNLKTALIFFFFCTVIAASEFIAYSVRISLFVITFGVVIGVILTPALDSLHSRLKTPRLLNAAILLLGIILFLVTLGFFLFNLLADQISSAIANEPQIIAKVISKSSAILDRYPWIAIRIDQLDLGSTFKNLLQQISHGVRLGGTFAASAVVAFVIGIYIAMNPSYYFEGLISLLPSSRRDDLAILLHEIAGNVRKWLVSQLLAMFIVGVATTLVLWIIGVDYWFVFGLMAGLLDVVPYLGPIIPLATLLVVNLAIDPEKIPWIIFSFMVIHQFENSFIVPLIFRYRMKFPPALLISTMLIMGSLFGVVGLICTPVFFSVLMTIYIHYQKPRSEVSIKTEPNSPEVPL